MPPIKNQKRVKSMSNQLTKEVEKAGTSISKEKLLEAIRKCPSKQFMYFKAANAKVMTVVVTLSL